jgi:FkbM family methyltransferase
MPADLVVTASAARLNSTGALVEWPCPVSAGGSTMFAFGPESEPRRMKLTHWRQRLLAWTSARLLGSSKLPNANVRACLLNLARRGFSPGLFIDVGAHKGKWSRELLRVFPDCRCVLIEPQVEMAGWLDRFCRRNADCRWINAGAGEQVGTLPFLVCPDTVSSRFAPSLEQAAAAGFPVRTTPVVTLDQIAADEGREPEIVKIDAEGFETQVLRGAASLIGRTELFFVEAQFFGADANPSGIVGLTAMMGDYGYVPYDFTWFGRRPFDGAIGLCEIAFARRDGILRQYDGWAAPAA